MQGVARVDVLGCPFDVISFDEVLEQVRRAIVRGMPIQIIPGNVDFIIKTRHLPGFAKDMARADLIVADGVPVTWAAKWLGAPLRGRVSGTDLVWRCAEIGRDLSVPIALIGAAPGVTDRTAECMRTAFRRAEIYAVPTPMLLDDEASLAIAKHVRARGAKIIMVALGAPRQERWVQRYLELCGALVGIGIGSAFDIICGDRPRAPAWMADNGLEWLHRMLQEPRRLGHRYLVGNSEFIALLAKEMLIQRIKKQVTE